MSENDKQIEHMKQMYKDQESGQLYDPKKKFGVIDGDQALIYDNITTSYPVHLPPDFYQKHIQTSMPKESDGKWFIRPHHLESLTKHPQSIKDDVLNTHYFSHYNQEYGKPKTKTDCEEAIDYIEKSLKDLRVQQKSISLSRGVQFTEDEQEELIKKQEKQAFE